MSNFKLFEQALDKYNSSITLKIKDTKYQQSCKHNDIVTENNITCCLDCGEEIQRILTHEKEWRFYGYSDSKRGSDPNRVQIRKSGERNINKDVENMGFSATIISKANNIYSEVTKGQIFRGESRKAVVFACIYHAYKIDGNSQTPKNLMKTFGLNKKSSLKGLKIVSVNTPKDSPIHVMTLSTVHHIKDIMDKFSATIEQKKEVVELYLKTKNRSSKLNRARPQSVACALTYYWIRKNKMNITLKKFAQKADLSELTINKNAKEIALILNTPKIL